MKLVYAVSQRVNTKRPTARHIDDREGKTPVQWQRAGTLLWAPDERKPTCKVCMDFALMLQNERFHLNTREITELADSMAIPISQDKGG